MAENKPTQIQSTDQRTKAERTVFQQTVLNGTPHAKELTQTADLMTFTRNNTQCIMVGLKWKM
jgi:hypothetical protein